MGKSDDVENIPSHLTEEEKIYYKFLVSELKISNLISNIDKPILEQTANCLYVMRACDDSIRKDGILIKSYDRNGLECLKQNPAIKVKLDYQTKYAQLTNQLGLSPAARSALAGKQIEAKQEAEDPVLKILSGGKIN